MDVSKAYDKAWLEAIMCAADKRGVKGHLWDLVKELNTNLKAKVRTNKGITRTINLDGTMRQGGITTTGLYSAHIDDITPELEKIDAGININDDLDKVAAIEWVDDIVAAETDPDRMQDILNIIDDIANKYKIEFGEDKSKVMVIGGNKEQRPKFHLGKINLKYTDTYKYLGIHKNSANNINNHLEETRKKTEAAYQTLLSITSDANFKGIQMQAVWKLYETCIQPIITYGLETWDLSATDTIKLDRLQESIIKRILMLPDSTPKEALYTETDLLDMESFSVSKRASMKSRLKQNPSSIIKNIFDNNIITWESKTNDCLRSLNLDNLSPKKNELKKVIKEKHQKKLINQFQHKSKLMYLKETEEEYTIEKKNYIQHLNRKEASTIFKVRTRMIPVKCNQKSSYTDLSCRLCGYREETQDHILFYCPYAGGIRKKDLIQDNNMMKLKKATLKIEQIIDQLNSAPLNWNLAIQGSA